MGDMIGTAVITYLVVMIAWVIPGFFSLDWNIFKSERRNKAMLKWYLILGNVVAIGLAIYISTSDF